MTWVPTGARSALIVVGGCVGTALRAGVAELIPPAAPPEPFPWATLAANVSGALVLGFVTGYLARTSASRGTTGEGVGAFLSVGLLGSYTTFSSFAIETFDLAAAGHLPAAVGYVALSLVLGLGAAWTGLRLGGSHSVHGGGP